MTGALSTNWSVFRTLCRVLGGQDKAALSECVADRQIPQLFDIAKTQNLLPALAVRCNEHNLGAQILGEETASLLKQALIDNTRRNMQISAQALKFTRGLNQAGIKPLLLKGTARLLAEHGGNLGFRKQTDIDLIVRPEELKVAASVLLADGYRFCHFPDGGSAVPLVPGDTDSAIKVSAAHHHLPALAKDSYASTVELHRHFLPRRFQRSNPLSPLFESAHTIERYGATFQVPSTEYQIIHLILGKLVNDGYWAGRSFPIREACDLINILESAEEPVDQQLVAKHCGRKYIRFHALVTELMQRGSDTNTSKSRDLTFYIRLMQQRSNSQVMRTFLDGYARVGHLTHALIHSPAKLPDYLSRISLWNQSKR